MSRDSMSDIKEARRVLSDWWERSVALERRSECLIKESLGCVVVSRDLLDQTRATLFQRPGGLRGRP